MIRVWLLLVALALMVGCAASGPTYTPHVPVAAEASILYIYRPSRTVNCCVAPDVYINGEKKGTLKNGGYLVYELPEGEHTVTVGDGSYGFEALDLTKQFSAGEETYLKWVVGNIKELNLPAMSAPRNYHLINMEGQKAKAEIANLKLSGS